MVGFLQIGGSQSFKIIKIARILPEFLTILPRVGGSIMKIILNAIQIVIQILILNGVFEMGKFRLQPREFRLRAGARTELDRQFLQIVGNLPEEANLSEFIKQAVVEHYQQHHKLSELDLLKQEFSELFDGFQNALMKFEVIQAKEPLDEAITQLKTELQTFIADLATGIGLRA